MGSFFNTRDASKRIQDLEYLYASNAHVSNFVSGKLSGDGNYHLWKTQMLCLMQSHNMAGIVDSAFARPSASSKHIMDQYDSLLKGWIFGSVSENVLGAIIDLASARDVWDRLKSFYDATNSPQQGRLLEANINGEETLETTCDEIVSTGNETESETKTERKRNLREAITNGDWWRADHILDQDKDLVREAISSDGSTVLHTAVGVGHNDLVKYLLFIYISDEEVLQKRITDGSTALHIAATVGNTHAAELLVKKNKSLLKMKDGNGEDPLDTAYKYMHLDTIGYLLNASKIDSASQGVSVHPQPAANIGVDLLVNAISAKNYVLASELVIRFPEFASKNDNVLMAIAKTFPSGDYEATFISPSWIDAWKVICYIPRNLLVTLHSIPGKLIDDSNKEHRSYDELFYDLSVYLICAVPMMLSLAYMLVCFLIFLVFSLFLVLFILWDKSIKILVPHIKHVEDKKKEMDEAERVLELVCDEIDKLEFSGAHHPYYTRPILEAACQNAHKVVDEILFRSPEAILCTDNSGYDIIQLAVIHRSEKIYNLIHATGERKNLYRTILDSSNNNILHLAGRLAPSYKLNKRRGAALQLQRELQWREEVKKVISPTFKTQENNFKETPDMVFTREHENLVKEGEQWMKTTAESCSITAALITTIVFAAAITVPGGSNSETGIPLFTKNIAFAIFAVSDAISLFASSTALLVFLSILTARFAEQDFLFSLPRRLLIGLCTLLLSAISMMVAFTATLYLVFCHQNPWMLAPICGLSLVPVSFFVALQFPLIVDLYRSTYLRIFGQRRRGKRARFNADSVRLFFGNGGTHVRL
uniref:Ankyrin repeat-containing domain, PGG domain, Gag-polypeptide of LTR copia-type n=1 Tax=Tanacetum cinerariifolium TaxID=118510 RepID=A0A6L2LVQ9_TANCI|nr:ankyrin repeat-containing domain, PGG domain, Gag-polypeptide of LTR copia-type [Tanacetum cinerariifolium]